MRWLFMLLALGSANAARADENLVFAPPASWVTAIEPPARAPDATGLEARLVDYQTRLDADGVHQFGHQIYRLSSLAAVQSGGTVTITWQPAFGRAIVHKLVIRRGDERIDVLKSGATFKVIQREAGLESLQLNGLLTAVMQVPDLRVGDELELSFTLEHRNPALGGHDDGEDFVGGLAPVDRLFVRYSWPQASKVRWRVGDRLPPVRQETKDGFAAIVLSVDKLKPPAPIPGAPTRYYDAATIQVTEFGAWRDVADVAAPLFDDAARIPADSPLNEEVRKIAAASSDPAARTAAALQLVQSQVRYFARLDGLGGFVPQPADVVWRTRSGDCKGKTVLLLALLRGLGVEAEPALVSTIRGDGLDRVLPGASRFNHVLVRATIGGKVYWLDGTRTGDRSLDQLMTPPFKWALPLGAQHRTLEALQASEPGAATSEWRLDLDARAGLGKPARAEGLGIFRGDEAAGFRNAASLLSRDALDQVIRKTWQDRHDWVTIDKVTYENDEVTGDVRIGFSGSGAMDWGDSGAAPANRYEANKARLGEDLAPKRDPEVANLAPVAVKARYEVVHQTILLPDGGKGFYLQGDPIDETVGGVHYTRTLTLYDGRFDMTAVTRSSAGEIEFTDAQAADKKTDALYDKQVFIHLPPGKATAQVPPLDGPSPSAEIALLAPAMKLIEEGRFNEAAVALDKLQLHGTQAKASAAVLRAILLEGLNRPQEASAALDEALALDRTHVVALSLKTELLRSQGRADDALILADRLVLVAPEDEASYRLRGYVRRDAMDNNGALADWDIAVDKQSTDVALYVDRLNLLTTLGRRDKAFSEADALVQRFPASALAQAARANMLARAGRREDAAKAAALSLTIKSNADAYLIRIGYGLSGDAKATLGEMLAVIRLEPERALPENALRKVLAIPGARQQLEAAYDAAKPASARQATAIHLARAMVAAAAGQPDALLAQLDAETAQHPRNASLLNDACYVRAMRGTQLDKALAECDAAIALDANPAYRDSRGLVRLRLKAYADAISDYDAALKDNATLPTSLYGRGLAKLRAGDKAGGDADLAAARKLSSQIDRTFAEMGLHP